MILTRIADIDFPTRWAHFRLLAFETCGACSAHARQETALALVLGNLKGSPLVRIHSQCVTGEAFHSLRCDCHDQLQLALRSIAQEGAGLLIYEQQEGRGIGLMEKLRAYQLQDQGLDTVDANLRLGHPEDCRDYALAVEILRMLNIRSLRLISNNPRKFDAIIAAGIGVAGRVAADVPENPHSSRYLLTKRERLGHFAGSSVDSSGLPAGYGSVSSTCADQESRGSSWQMF